MGRIYIIIWNIINIYFKKHFKYIIVINILKNIMLR